MRILADDKKSLGFSYRSFVPTLITIPYDGSYFYRNGQMHEMLWKKYRGPDRHLLSNSAIVKKHFVRKDYSVTWYLHEIIYTLSKTDYAVHELLLY